MRSLYKRLQPGKDSREVSDIIVRLIPACGSCDIKSLVTSVSYGGIMMLLLSLYPRTT